MKKLFTLVVLMCLLGVNRVWASRDFYFFSLDGTNIVHNVVKKRANENEVAYVDCYFRYMNNGGNVKSAEYNQFKFKVEVVGDLQLADGSAFTYNGQERTDITQAFQIRFKGRGGAIIVSASHKNNNYANNGWSTFFVITAPYIGNQTWDFFEEANTEMTYYHANGTYPYWVEKTKFSGHADRPIQVVDMDYDKGHNNYYNDGHDNIDGTNARYIPATAGLVFNCPDEGFGVNDNSKINPQNNQPYYSKRYVTWGKTGSKLTIPHLKGGTYVRIWCDCINAGEFGGHFLADGLLDLEGNLINSQFTISGVTDYGLCQGNTIFKVAGNSNEYRDVSLTLNDDGWNDIYKIQVMDEYETDMILADNTDGWGNEHTVLYNNDFGTIVHNGSGTNRSYSGHSGKSRIQRARSLVWEVTKEGDVTYQDVPNTWEHNGVPYTDLQLNNIKGTGNIKIIQREKFDGYTLDKNETWIAVGTYTKQKYPYTWDFTAYNIEKHNPTLTEWLEWSSRPDLDNENYGYWVTNNNVLYSLETHVPVNASDINSNNHNQPWMNEKVDKPLFAQGSQLTGGTTAIHETEGLRVKQYIRQNGEDHIACGEEYDGEIIIDGTALKFTPKPPSDPNLDHRLKITIPQVDDGMYVFVKANYQPNVYKGTTKINSIDTYSNADDVGAYPVSGTGDIDLYFDKKKNIEIYSIGVTNIIKPVNQYGYATESRDRTIDHTYTGKFTSNDVNAYLMKDYDGTKVTMVETDVIPENTGVVMYKSGTSTGFNAPLFVNACNVGPDETTGNLLKPNVSSSTLNMKEGDYTNFILTDISYHIKHMDDVSTMWSGEDKIGFYRVGKAGTLGANKSYLQLPTSDLNTSVGAKGLVLIWDGFGIEEPSGITTSLEQVGTDSYAEGEKDIYNLHGQKLDNVSGRKGIFIVNGKKVIVK